NRKIIYGEHIATLYMDERNSHSEISHDDQVINHHKFKGNIRVCIIQHNIDINTIASNQKRLIVDIFYQENCNIL
ncbi:26320_t:CDS:1, partial [Gigaspora rosea]